MNKINKSNKSGVITIYNDDFNGDNWREICSQLDLCPHETQQIEIHARHSISSGDGFSSEIEEYSRERQKSLLEYHMEDDLNVKNDKITVSVYDLYCNFDEYLSYTVINIPGDDEGDEKYFDLVDKYTNKLACMDGESCIILDETGEYVLLMETDSEIEFKLSLEEFRIVMNSVVI